MRKILSIFAALVFAFAANAAVINIDNTTADALRTALNSAADGDEIVMAAGTYVESNSNYIAFDGKAVTVKAAEGANVIIQPQVPITVSNGGHAIFENVKIDASHLTDLADWYEHLLYVTDENPNGCTFRGCEIYGFNLNKSMFYCNTANKVAAMKFEDCYFHDIMKSIIFIENTAGKPMVSVKKCTFENISTNTESYWAGVIDVRADEATLQVDHCTFYNVIPMNTDYSCVSKITLAKGTVSNCIFMLPTAQDGIRAMRGVTATNCITFNYLKDNGTGIHSSVTQTNCVQVDPAFVDPDNGNFTLAANSPALTMNDGEPIGDPRWVPAAAPAHTYTVAGGSDIAFGTTWDPANETNDMTLVEGLYTWEQAGLTLAAGNIEFKVCEDHAWTVCYPAQNYALNIAEAGIYTIKITFNADTKEVAALATKTGDAVVIPTVAMHGNFLGSWADTQNFAVAEGDATASLTLTLAEGNYEFGMRIGGSGNWTSNGVAFTRENNAAEVVAGQGNLTLAADAAGEYTFTWTYETNTLAITFPAIAAPSYNLSEIDFVAPATADEIDADASFTVDGFTVAITDPDNKMSIDANACRFGTATDYKMYSHRLKTGGKSSETKNFMTLTIPEAGILRLAVRTGSNSATDRNLVIVQGENTLYDQVIVETMAVKVMEGETEVSVYPYVEVPVEAGTVALSYPVNGLNFYAFVLMTEAAPEPVNPIVETYFATGDGWAPDAESSAIWDAEAQKVTVNIALDKVAQWQAQVKYQALASEPSKFYHFALKMKANNAVSGITVKWDDNTGLVLKENVALEANAEYVIDLPQVASNAAGNGIIVFDFGFAHAGDVIEIYDVVVEEVQAPAVDLVDGYYILGLNGWSIYDIVAADMFEANPENEGEYMLNATLAANQEFKVVSIANNEIAAYYPAEAGNYVVDLAHSGDVKVVYFRPDYQGGEGWHAGCIFVPENEAPVNPIDHTYFATGSGWGEDTESNAVWDPETGKITVTLAMEKVAAWQGQVFVNTVKAEPGKCYNFSVKMKANKNMSGVTIKWQENNNDPKMVSEINTISLVADEEFVFSQEQIAGVDGNGMVIYDFGYAEAGTIVEIYDLVIEETECPAQDAKYYLVGTITDWKVVADDAHLFVATETAGEYKLHITLAENDGLKVVGVEGEAETWYPDGMGNEYVVDAAHAGEKDILFRPAGNPEWAAFGGYIFIEANQGIENTAVDVKAVKMIENGQFFIELNGVRYNVTGVRVR